MTHEDAKVLITVIAAGLLALVIVLVLLIVALCDIAAAVKREK